jgi:hypothetical protein
LYFATDATSQKAGNIELNNKVSAAIASETQDAYKLRGLSMSGIPGGGPQGATPQDAHESKCQIPSFSVSAPYKHTLARKYSPSRRRTCS